jgi:hypothetical protein
MALLELLQDTQKLAALIPKPDAGTLANRLYQSGDHWQKEDGWMLSVPNDLAQRDSVIANAVKAFTPIPVLSSCVSRHTNGVVGHEPAFSFALKNPTEDPEPPAPELDSLIGAWWDSRNGHEILHEWVETLLVDTRAVLRLFVPADRLQTDENGQTFAAPANLEAALDDIYFEVAPGEASTVAIDPDSFQPLSVYRYQRNEGTDANTGAATYYALSFVALDGATVFQVQREGKVVFQLPLDLDGELLMYEATRKPFLTEPVRAQQRALDFLNSMIPRNGQYAGFRGRHLFGVQPPTRQNSAGDEEMVAPVLGPGVVNLWQSTTYTDDDGNQKTAPASMTIEEPVDSSPLRADVEHNISNILESLDQGHIAITGDANASGVALVQKRAAFAQSLLKTKPKVEGAVRWLIRTALLLAAALSNDSGVTAQLKDLRVNAQAKMDTGPLTPDERRVIVEQLNAGVMDKDTALTMLGSDDIDAVRARIEEDRKSDPVYQAKVVALFAAWAQVYDGPDAAELAGIEDERILSIIRRASQSTLGVNDGG